MSAHCICCKTHIAIHILGILVGKKKESHAEFKPPLSPPQLPEEPKTAAPSPKESDDAAKPKKAPPPPPKLPQPPQLPPLPKK